MRKDSKIALKKTLQHMLSSSNKDYEGYKWKKVTLVIKE